MKVDFSTAQLIACAVKPEDFPNQQQPEIAFVGRSNVGKSSLINRLAKKRNLARTSSTPGKTRMIFFFDVQQRLRLVDLPGYGYAAVSGKMKENWRVLVEQYFASRNNLRGVVAIMDIRHAPTGQDLDLLDWLHPFSPTIIPVLNKADKLPFGKRKNREKQVRTQLGMTRKQDLIIFSALKGLGIKELEAAIAQAAFRDTHE